MSTIRAASGGGLLATLAVAAACTGPSLDARDDLARARAAALDRTGLAPSGWPDGDTAAATSDAPPAASAGWQGVEPLSLELALETAFRRTPEIAMAKPRLAAARARFVEAATPPNPVLRWMVGVPLDPVEAVPFLIGISTDLARLLERDVLEEVARHRLDAEVLAVADLVVAKVVEVRLAHARAVAGVEELEVRTALRDLAATRLREIEDRIAVGEASRAARSRSAAGLETAAAMLAEAEGEARTARLRLLRTIGWPGGPIAFDLEPTPAPEVADLLDRLAGEAPVAAGTPLDRRLAEIARDRRLDLLASDLEARARLAEIGLAERAVWRGLSFGVGVDRDMEGMRGVPFSGTVPLPLFDDGRIGRGAATAAWRTALLDRLVLVQRIELEVREAVSDLQTAREVLARRAARLADLAELREAAADQYAAGLGSLDALRDAERTVLEGELAEIAARFGVAAAAIGLQEAMGGGGGTAASAELAAAAAAPHARKESS